LSGDPWTHYNPTSVGRHWAIPGRVAEDLGIDPDLTPQEKLDALDEAGFVSHPSKGSDAMPTYHQYLDDSPGMRIQDIWGYQPHTQGVLYGTDAGIDEDVRWLVRQGDTERLGYPTQKPLGLLERVIRSSTDEGDLVLDPFCGCGTTVTAAQTLKRRWVGIDITYLAIALIKSRLSLVRAENYSVSGEPTTEEDAEQLAADDPYQFQWWALGLVGARPAQGKKGADAGIDGRLFFFDVGASPKQAILSVNAGKVQVGYLRDLIGVLDREKAQIGVLISLNQPTQPMRQEAASAGFYESLGHISAASAAHDRRAA
jgi:DNA methylase